MYNSKCSNNIFGFNMALTNDKARCEELSQELNNIRTEISRLERIISDDEAALERGLGNRVRVIIENGQLRQKPSLSDQEIQQEANKLRQNIQNTRNKLQDAERTRETITSEFNRLSCSRWIRLF